MVEAELEWAVASERAQAELEGEVETVLVLVSVELGQAMERDCWRTLGCSAHWHPRCPRRRIASKRDWRR
eukprot:COSAG02_NODE_32697_length_512_cov_0.750605_1_plen_70_part_00